MPTYNYICNNCQSKFSAFQGINEDNKDSCPECKVEGKVDRLITGGTGMIFKGEGFYITDYTNYGKKENTSNEKEKKTKNDINKKKNKGKIE